jgi:hypothetical protein
MAMNALYGLSITANKKEILVTLRKNREEHQSIVKEARVVYAKKAEAAIMKKLDALRSGKIVSLAFQLAAPLDYTTVYDTAIRALELHTGDTIDLSADQVRNLVDDTWDWTGQFMASNSLYSEKLKKKLSNFDPEDD